MTKDDIMKMARDAGFYFYDAGYAPILHTTKNEYSEKCFERFASLVAAAEREACADILDRNADRCDPYSIAFDVLDSNAKAIRARGNK